MVAMSREDPWASLLALSWRLKKTIALSPDFAPAWFNLASIYSLRKETLPKALDAAQHAASLVPGDAGYQYQVAVILQNLDEPRRPERRLSEFATLRAI